MTGVLREATTISFGDEFVGEGWHFRQPHGDGDVRWTGPEPESWVDFPLSIPAGSTVEVHVVGSVDDKIAAGMTLDVNGARVPLTVTLLPEGGLRYSGTVRAHPSHPSARLVIRVPYTVPFPKPPPRAKIDPRVGVAVTSIRLSPPDRSAARSADLHGAATTVTRR